MNICKRYYAYAYTQEKNIFKKYCWLLINISLIYSQQGGWDMIHLLGFLDIDIKKLINGILNNLSYYTRIIGGFT